jgi:type IV pilus assembly protein PilM
VQAQLATMQTEERQLKTFAGYIQALDNQLADSVARSQQLEQAVIDRSYWVRLLMELNNKFENDLIWLTQIHPLKDGVAVTPALVMDANAAPASPESSGPKPVAGAEPVYTLEMDGLWRFDPAKNPDGEQVVYRFAEALAKSSFFDGSNFEKNRAEIVSAESGVEGDRYAYKFKIKLPLKQPMQFTK